MAKFSIPCLLMCAFVFSCAQVKKVQQKEKLPTAIPELRILNDTTATSVKITSLNIDITIAANIATTTFDIIFYNPNERVLEGEFEFPLADGQHIVRYALDIEGKLREGVVVEKAKARIAFENTVRRNIDPGLIEKTKGNNFRTRIYPLPAKGSRHIVVAIEQILPLENKNCLYQLPLFAAEPINEFSLKTTVLKSTEKPLLEESSLSNFSFRQWKEAWVATHQEKNFAANSILSFSIPRSLSNETISVAEKKDDQTYFYVNSYMETAYRPKTKPLSIGILWDISASGEKRNLQKEQEILKKYIAYCGNVDVSLIPFNTFVQEKEDFSIRDGNSDPLMEKIKSLKYDGGTQFGALVLAGYSFEEILLFSDGLSSFGKKEIIYSRAPVYTINSLASADYSFLKYVGQQSHGKFIDLTGTETKDALLELQQQSLQIIAVDYNPSEIEDLVLPIPATVNKGLSFAGKLKVPQAVIKIALGFGNETTITKTFIVSEPESSEYDQVKRIWATLKISELELRPEKNKEAITALGKEFSVVTQNTSLIVLDRIEDYAEHEIVPPADLQKQYYSLLKEKKANEKNEKESALLAAVEAMNELKDWWNTDFSRKKIKQFTPPVTVADSQVQSMDNGTGIVTSDSARINGSTNLRFSVPSADGYAAAPPPPMEQLEAQKVEFRFDAEYKYLDLADKLEDVNKSEADRQEASINLKEWKPDVPYLKELEKTSAKNRKAKYFELKKQYADQPSFYIDVARFFIEKNEKQFGIQVLSNVAEMKLEDASLLRIVAHQLMDAGETVLAIETCKDILTMREEEPQPYRDLALAYNEAGKYNEAVELFYKLILGAWDVRFDDIKAIALNEMNAIISTHKEKVNTKNIDNRLIFAMPVDVRIVISWNADNSDMDLWVTDPGKEKCSYENTQTTIGGRISQDVTQGYGPEEFCLKKATDGSYTVEVNLFGDTRQTLGGPIAIKADLFTDFGRPTQKKQTINFRISNNKEVVHLGLLKFGN